MKKTVAAILSVLVFAGCGADEQTEERQETLNLLKLVWEETPIHEKTSICNEMNTYRAEQWAKSFLHYRDRDDGLTVDDVIGHYRDACEKDGFYG